MNFANLILITIVSAVAVISVAWLVRHFFSASARWERRRRRSNTRVASTAKRPMVRFSVRVPKAKD